MAALYDLRNNPTIFSDFELVTKVLNAGGSATAREISAEVTKLGVKWDKGQANSVLYKMLSKKIVEKDASQGTRPVWSVAKQSTGSNEVKENKLKVINTSPGRDEFIPLKAVSEYSLTLNQNLIEFAVNLEASGNDPYISCDWLENKIFVAINSQHPYIFRGISNDLILTEFLLFLALDAFCEWRVIRDQNLMKVHSFIEIKDSVLRGLN